MESLAQLEVLCERLYNSQDSAERTHAENTLKCFSTNIDYISQCQYILDNALTPYALMLASSSLLKQVTEHSLSLQLRLDIPIGRLQELALSLSLKCLSFDFVGTSIDESSEEFGTVQVTTPLLKFMAEFVLNKAQRLTFDTSSPNGILLFREVVFCIYGFHNEVLFGILLSCSVTLTSYFTVRCGKLIMQSALAGNYVNFGVFELYGDRALADALDIALKMTLSIPLADILAYRKLTRAYFAFLEVLFNSHLVFVLSLGTHTFMHIVGSLESGLKGLDAGISTQCASAVDNLAAFYFNNITMGEAPTSVPAANLARHIAECPAVLPEVTV
ncbi:UNVERIFIED_CONTAM: Exportin-7-A [Sesamum radiatum]|uniref:Exportin-7-A n=1 Tax=Sesamum radiatum TaxID=300843 RepID=A0AAW2J4P0_SESRA